MIRIEDTDQSRSSDESARGILEDLAWLGIEWNDGPAHKLSGGRVIGEHARDVGGYFQARRVAIYNAYIESLVKAGRAYPAFESDDEIKRQRKEAEAQKRTYKYPRPADVHFGVFNQVRWDRACAGESHVVRFLMDDGAVVVPDQVLGDVKIAPGEVDDFVIRKSDGFPTYHFAVVIDDELMGVSHVMRAQEHLANTPRHVAMQRALKRLDSGAAFRTPGYAHMPLIFNMDGTKMSKRDKAKTARKAIKDMMAKDKNLTVGTVAAAIKSDEKIVKEFLAADNDNLDVATALAAHYKVPLPEIEIWDFRQSGYLPEAILNFIALLGWNPGMKLDDGKDLEKFDMAFMAKHFSVDRIGKTNAKFDRAKLLSFNADALQGLSDAEFAKRWMGFLGEYEPASLAALQAMPAGKVQLIVQAVKPRARTLRDAINSCRFAFVADDGFAFDSAAMDKLRKADPKNGPDSSSPRTGVDLLHAAAERLSGIADTDFVPLTLHTVLEQLAQQLGCAGTGQLAQPLRVAVTGAGVSPGIDQTLSILGKASVMKRIERCLHAITH